MHMTLNREFYIPTDKPNLEQVEATELGLVFYTYDHETTGRPVVKAFHGKKAKPIYWEVYLTAEKRAARIAGTVEAYRQDADRKAARKAERAAPHTYKVGDILVSNWGYSMSLNSFYKVVATTPNGLTLQPLGSKLDPERAASSEPGFYGYEVADETAVKGTPFKVRCGADNRPKVSSHAWAHAWDGKGQYYNKLD